MTTLEEILVKLTSIEKLLKDQKTVEPKKEWPFRGPGAGEKIKIVTKTAEEFWHDEIQQFLDYKFLEVENSYPGDQLIHRLVVRYPGTDPIPIGEDLDHLQDSFNRIYVEAVIERATVVSIDLSDGIALVIELKFRVN